MVDQLLVFSDMDDAFRNSLWRTVTEELGFEFIEEEELESSGQGEYSPGESLEIIETGVCASSKDADDQDIHQTVDNQTNSFWSSVGSDDPDIVESLVYRLSGPVSIVDRVALTVHRASYQPGAPIYPPEYIQFGVGVPENLTVSPKMKVTRTAETQVFDLKAEGLSMAGPYLVVFFHGALQKQYEDNRFYLAIEKISAFGERCNTPQRVWRFKESSMRNLRDAVDLAKYLSS
eukprot:CAMPEP_0113968440 /NCGR_PEP_ID=MMETSP0011_2-20120614/9538_1 /TAXON_ID=101924 /ORGANISM="Rhodosorus marinus" /LENGTH=232 /DNA_ID=CAMNT_0000981537 /DNA_START=413 /DNA_END=1111 /DNA_ORIENTATION=- /assembly_acc=CAM_ASM_000156